MDRALLDGRTDAAPLGPSRTAQQQQEYRLIRSVLLASGVVVASFRKNTHETHTIVLEHSGHAYTYIHPNGSQTRHLSPTARSSHRAMLIDAVRMRNQFASHAHASSTSALPYVHRTLCEQRDGGISSSPLIRRPAPRSSSSSSASPSDEQRVQLCARWPAGEFNADALLDAATQCYEVQSIEGNARVRLYPSAAVVDAFFLVRAMSSGDSSTHSFFATAQQTFAAQHTPPCFAYAVALLQHAQRAHATGQRAFTMRSCSDHHSEPHLLPCSAVLPENGAFTARPTFTAIAAARASADQAEGDVYALTRDDVLRVASRPTRRLYAHVAAEATEDATFLVSRGASDARATVLVLLAGRTGVIECARGFFRWFGGDGRETQQFTIETIPPSASATARSAAGALGTPSSSSLEALCRHAMELAAAQGLDSTRASGVTTDQRSVTPLEPLQSSAVVEAVETPLGRFRAFADRRVRVVFTDRTILQVDAAHEHCAFFYPDGSVGHTTVRAASAAPLSHEHQCIERALEFGDWAFATPRERMLRHVRRQLHDEVASQELRKISVRCGLNRDNGDSEDRARREASKRPSESATREDESPQASLALVQQLQDATQRHIASVNALLRDASAVASSR